MLIEGLQILSRLAIPSLLVLLLIVSAARRLPVYELFVEGAGQGFDIVLKIFPYLLSMFVAIGILRDTGALDAVLALIGPPAEALGIPREVLPLAFLRPLSGSGALGVMTELLGIHGPDSMIGRLASIMQGSTETTFYVLTVYFGAVGIRRMRHAIAVGLLADLAAFIAAVFLAGRM